ncbi:hypothetical protein Acr_25g0000370 [Actinidia rufa]|uniref:Retrotransposon gag domain-containing protein n=1 Tax=Actinidia rufa TaxID=165716 RepID=A0A7J0GY23_9ERIC|nr:hypothetical protein Acr_25g0000370 [Actinidia rufa]
MPPRLRERDGGRVRGRAPVRAGGRSRSLGRGRGRVEGASSASSVSGGHDEAPQMFHFTPEALREFVRAIRDEIQRPPPPPPVAVEPVVHRAPAEPRAQSTMREFRRQDPPRFSGEPDPIEAELWLKRINLAFEMIELDEDVLHIRAATYQFSGRALTWWDVVKATHNVAMMTWADFERYAAQFNDLARFAPECVATDYLRARCFEQGLRPGLRGKVVSFELNTFEEGNSLRGKGKSIRSDNNSPPILSHSSLSSRGLPLSTSLGVHISQTQGQNQQSGQPQLGYKPPSLAISAPLPSSQASRASAPRGQQQAGIWGQPRLYAVTDIALEPSVIRGTFPIFNSWATVLIDTGASCSFIASAFAFALGLEVDLLDSTLLVDTPVGGMVPLNRVFDIILGMDWLSSNRAIVDCFRRRVTITISSGDSFYFVGDRLDFSTSSLHHLCGRQYTTGYLASLWTERAKRLLANVVADALSRKPRSTAASLAIHEWKMLEQLGEFDLEVGRSTAHATLFTLVAQPTLLSRVLEAQQSDEEAVSFRAGVTSDEAMDGWTFSPDSGLRYRSRPFVPLALRDDTKELQGAPTKNAVSGDFPATSDLRPKHESCSSLQALRFQPIGIPIGFRLGLRFFQKFVILQEVV